MRPTKIAKTFSFRQKKAGKLPAAGDLTLEAKTVTTLNLSIVNSILHQQLTELLEQHGPALWLFARQWCSAADDVVQEAMIELARQIEFPANPKAWLFTTVRRRAINHCRAESRRGKHEKFAAEEREAWYENDPSKSMSANEDGYQIQTALQGLSQLDREIVVARIWGDMSFEQVAELVDSSISAVHRRYHESINRLKDSLVFCHRID